MTGRRLLAFGSVLALAAVPAVGPEAHAVDVMPCEAAALQARAPAGTRITNVQVVDAAPGRAKYCQVDGQVAVPDNTVSFRLGLPDAWNGKFYFQGVGGLGGAIGSLETGLARGYASASTDTGHTADDPTWGANRAKEIDYGHRGTHVTAVAAKALSAAFYGKPPAHAYFNGCSNGGRQALMEVQRYPEDFDGIIGGDPATGTPMQVGRAVVYQHMLASPANYLPPAKIERLSTATLAACDRTDGLEDGLITDPRRCAFDPQVLACKGADGPDCLTTGQLATVRRIYGGVKTGDGQTYAHGFPPGHEGGATGWTQWIAGTEPPTEQSDGCLGYGGPRLPAGFGLMESNFRFLALDDDAPTFDWRVFDVTRDLPRMQVMTDILSPTNPDLRPYQKRGGKLLLYHGWSDPGISALGTVAYYEQMVRTVGGQPEADRFARLYMVPGMHHCSGGPGPNQFDTIAVLENWVERDVSPAAIVASRVVDGKTVRTRPLCPHPQVARYSGQGSVDDASSFSCGIP